MPVMTESREVYKLDLAAEVLCSGGTIRLQALGSSMLPTIWPGDVLNIEPKSGAEIVPGDIVLVARDNRFFIHRLIEKRNSTWTTRGDSLSQADAPVAPKQVLGRVSLIHREACAIVPKPRLSMFSRMLASMFRWDLFRNNALRLHSLVTPPSGKIQPLREL
jgi:Peptidase S24-like